MLIEGREPLSWRSKEVSSGCTKELENLGNQLGSTEHETGKNPSLNSDVPQEAEGESEQLPKAPKKPTFWG
jgi:hypothetical protein